MQIVPARQSLSDFQFKLGMIPLRPQAPGQPAQLSLFCATSLEIYQVANWCRASPKNTLGDLPLVNDPGDLTLKGDGMALCLYDDTMKIWSTVRDWVPQWGEVGLRIAEAIEKNPTIQSSWNVNHLNLGPESLRNFREDLWVNENGSIRPVPSPFMLGNSLEEEIKKIQAEFINLPYDEEEEGLPVPHSPFGNVSDAASTPPLSPCTPFLSPDSPSSPEPESPFLLALPLSLGGHRTISPHEIFSPLPHVGGLSGAVMEPEAPPAPVVSTQPLPSFDMCSDVTPPTSPDPPPFCPSPPPVASSSTSKKTVLKRSRESDENDEFTPERRRVARPGKRTKVGTPKRVGAKLEGKSTKCDLCGKRLGRATDLPRHKASCEANPERATRETPCEICGKLLPVRADAVKRHLESKTCRSKRRKGDEDPYLSES